MCTPSTSNLSEIPSIDNLKKLCKAISTLDAMICPNWEYRYYSYRNNWDTILGEERMLMRNGSGDEFSIIFSRDGAIINGLAHESVMSRWSKAEGKAELIQDIWTGVVDNVPNEFQHVIFGEPIKSTGTTFCIWRKYTDQKWNIGNIIFPKEDFRDGSGYLLSILDNKPETYYEWAAGYYEDEFDLMSVDIDLIHRIYNHEELTKDIVLKFNYNVEDFDKLKADLDQIGYPYAI